MTDETTETESSAEVANPVDALVRRGLFSCAPTYIYIQACGDCEDNCKECLRQWPYNDDITWCCDKINDSDVEYVQVDIATAMIQDAIHKPTGVVSDSVLEFLKQNGERA